MRVSANVLEDKFTAAVSSMPGLTNGFPGHCRLAISACFSACIAKSIAGEAKRIVKAKRVPDKNERYADVHDVLGRFCRKENAKYFGYPYDAKNMNRLAQSITDRVRLPAKLGK